MEIFTTELTHELLTSHLGGFLSAWELRGVFAAEAIKLIALPLQELSIASCLVALGWIAIFWKNKGFFFSGVLHILGLAEFLTNLFGRRLSWRKM